MKKIKMRKYIFLAAIIFALSMISATSTFAQCAKIQSGTIKATNGITIHTGFDEWGYNYQAHMFNGLSQNVSRPSTPATEGSETLVMKWSEDWLSNLDCDHTQILDRGGDGTDGGSKGWVTNHYEGDYVDLADGETYHYTYFVKIVWVGLAPTEGTDPWIGKRIWGQFAIIEEVYNDSGTGDHGRDRSRLVNPAGLGFYTN